MTDTATTRAFTRVPVHLVVEIETLDGIAARGALHDVSMTGLSIELDGRPSIPADTLCSIRIELDTGSVPVTIVARGRVLRVEGGVVAMRITAVDPDSFDHLERLILYNAPRAEVVEDEFETHADEQPPVAPLTRLE
jgi:PilZ domain-containing protein